MVEELKIFALSDLGENVNIGVWEVRILSHLLHFGVECLGEDL